MYILLMLFTEERFLLTHFKRVRGSNSLSFALGTEKQKRDIIFLIFITTSFLSSIILLPADLQQLLQQLMKYTFTVRKTVWLVAQLLL